MLCPAGHSATGSVPDVYGTISGTTKVAVKMPTLQKCTSHETVAVLTIVSTPWSHILSLSLHTQSWGTVRGSAAICL